MSLTRLAVFVALVFCGGMVVDAQASAESQFTYQGRLDMHAQPYTGTADFQFTLWDAPSGGSQIGSVNAKNGVEIEDGLFTAELDFGAEPLQGTRYLQIRVRAPSGSGDFFTFPDRTRISASPFSIRTRGLYVNEAGNRVAIGTQDPTHTLHVTGSSPSTALFQSSSPDGSSMNLSSTGPGGRGWMFTSSASSTPGGAGKLLIYPAGTTNFGDNALTVHPSGVLGVLTTSPQDSIHIGSGALRFPDGSRQFSAYAPVIADVPVVSFVVPGNGQNTLNSIVPGAQPGMTVVVTPPYDLWPFHSIGFARVIAPDTVRFSVVSNAAGDRTYSANTWRFMVFP
ncbi:MAG: hypothetical protein LAT64_10895 [Phycisphaerales bacterium]|nr:hypothetical protein [Planctomycetota bacterium]MCH8509257.1 hypothetical protein [Phycisphaerales bacterium]